METFLEKKQAEKGAALVLVLVVLMTLTVFGIGVMVSSATNNALSMNFEKATQALNVAEIGTKVAYRELINSGFLKTSHTMGMDDEQTGEQLLDTTLDNYYIDEDGNFVWEWEEGDGYNPLWPTDKPHGFRFRVFYSTYNSFVIECEGWFDNLTRRIRARGQLESMFQFSYFASRDMGEFVRGTSQEIRGKVHANGNLYVRPSGSTLRVNTSSFSATGYIIRSRDSWGRPDESGACEITKNSQDSGIWVEMVPGSPRGSEGVAMESRNPNWNHPTLGARELWEGVVRDRVPYKSPPPMQGLDPGGYYDSNADLIIDSSASATYGWCTTANIYNFNEQMTHQVQDVDVAAMDAAGDWPSNGLIYCEVPTRFYNMDEIPSRAMIASCRNVYTKGDVNTTNKKGMSIMTKHRIYILSQSWDDASPKLHNDSGDRPDAVTTRINAALVDGAPTVDEYNWCDRDVDRRYDDSNRLIYDDWAHKTAAGFNNPDDSDDPCANCDDLIEDWGGQTLTKFGSTVHLDGATMTPNLDNSGIQPDELAWVQRTGYNPPIRAYSYDPDLATPSGQPPFTPLIGHISSWEPY
ncbi:PilX N-terminal domain-containing pilus assembly protein [Candidatus Latescibacterota bacterium]